MDVYLVKMKVDAFVWSPDGNSIAIADNSKRNVRMVMLETSKDFSSFESPVAFMAWISAPKGSDSCQV